MVQLLIRKIAEWTSKERERYLHYMSIDPLEDRELAVTAYVRAEEAKAQLLRALEAWDYLNGNHGGWPGEQWIQLPTSDEGQGRGRYWHKIDLPEEKDVSRKKLSMQPKKTRGSMTCPSINIKETAERYIQAPIGGLQT